MAQTHDDAETAGADKTEKSIEKEIIENKPAVAEITESKSESQEPNDETQPKEEKDEESNTENPKDEESTENKTGTVIELSDEEKEVHSLINTEKESITKSIDNMLQSLNKFDTDSQQKTVIINDSFDALITLLNTRKSALINQLNSEVLSQKTVALKQIDSLKQYQQTIGDIDAQYQTLASTDNDTQRKQEILSLPKKFDPKISEINFAAAIKLRLDTEPIETMLKNFGTIRIGESETDYDEEKVPSFIDSNGELLLAEIPVKRVYFWMNEKWAPRGSRTIILFYQNKKSYKVRMIVKQNESDNFLMNQWVSTKDLIAKDNLVWSWTAFDACIAKEQKQQNKGFTKWSAKFFDDIAHERFEDQFNQARKINTQVLDNEAKIRNDKRKQQRLKREFESMEKDENSESESGAVYYENDEKLCFEMDVWKTYLWSKDANGKGAWKGYAEKSVLQFFENRKNKKVRVVLTENESKELKLNHWIPTDVELKSRGEQMWEWQVYDDLATKFLKNSTLKLATICGTFIDKKDTAKFKELFEKYQKINQRAEEL